MTLRRALTVLFGLVALALLLVLLAPAWYGPALLERLGGQYRIRATSVSGPLWAPSLHGLSVSGPGVQVQAKQAGVRLSTLLPGKAARLDVALQDADVNIKLKEVLSGQSKTSAPKTPGAAWHVLPGKLDIQNVRVNLDGKGANIPNGRFTVTGQSSDSNSGRVQLVGQSEYGDLNAKLTYRQQAGQLSGALDINSDARIVNNYWPGGGVTGGRITGQYRFGRGPLEGELKVVDGVITIPQARFIEVKTISGRATHRGNLIEGALSGVGLGGPVDVKIKVDTHDKHWQADGVASPTFMALGQALGLSGSGQGHLKVSAGGWTTVNVQAQLSSEQGEFITIPFRHLGAAYTFQTRNRNDLSVQADTALQGAAQKLWGNWAFGKAGQARWSGDLAGQPLQLRANIDALNTVQVTGRALGGPIRARYGLRSRQLSAQASPRAFGLSGELSAQGQVSDLALTARQLKVGPLVFSGAGTLNRAGLSAELNNVAGGRLRVQTDRQFSGNWQVQGLQLAGVQAGGSGAINLREGLSGQLSARVPGVTSSLSGPLNINWKRRSGEWQAGAQRLMWQGQTFTLLARDLVAQGLTVNGGASYRAGQLLGQLRATGHGLQLSATGEGQQARLLGQVGGVNVRGLSQLKAPYTTALHVQGSAISGEITFRDGVAFRLNTAGQQARGTVKGQSWNASGGVNLASLRPLLGSRAAALSGNVQLHLLGTGGTASVNAQLSGMQVRGVLTRQAAEISAEVRASTPQLQAKLSGLIYPRLKVSGPVDVRGVSTLGQQRLYAQVNGPYTALQVQASGRTSALTFGAAALPAQDVRLVGSLTPVLALNGVWGDLKATYRAGQVSLNGRQAFTASGRSGQVQLEANWQPDFSGQVRAAGQLGEYNFSAAGPWTQVQFGLSGAGLIAKGRANARTQQYAAQVRGQLAGLQVAGDVRGQGAKVSGTLQVRDDQGGQASLKLNSLQSFTLDAGTLHVAGQTVQGRLSAEGGLLSGKAQLGPLSVQAQRGQFSARGNLYQHVVQVSGRLVLPAHLPELRVQVDGPYLSAQASGSGSALSGNVNVKAQRYRKGGLNAQVPAQVLPLSASLTPLRANVGGLSYQGGAWSGHAALRYAAQQQGAQLLVVGQGRTLSAQPTGLLRGQVTLLPALSGTLQAELSPLKPLLPAQVRTNLAAGQLQAEVHETGATLTLSGARWLGEALNLNAQVQWRGGVRASGVLSSNGSRLPVQYVGGDLSVNGAVIDARALKPFLDASGQVQASLQAPGLDFARASGAAQVKLQARGQSARGSLRLASGQLSANLSSTLGHQAASLTGAIYPRANAQFTYANLRGGLSGDARTNAGWVAQAAGNYQGKAVQLRAKLSPQDLSLSGALAGLTLDLQAKRATPSWLIAGTFDAADLQALTGQRGALTGTLSGTLADVRAQISGSVAGVAFNAPLRYRAGQLNVQSVSLRRALGQGQARATLSGAVYPALNLSGQAKLSDVAPGDYALTASGSFGRARLTLRGALSGDVQGLGIAGTKLSGVLSGKDFVVQASGEKLAGQARGRTDFSPYLQSARLTLNAPYQSGDTRLQLRGPLGWNAKAGWIGSLRAVGQAPGGALDASLSGHGPLQVTAVLGQAKLSGEFPSSLPLRPAGQVTLHSLDLGAFWQRPAALSLSGQAVLNGPTWANLVASFSGQLSDAQGQLSGPLSGQYSAGNAAAQLSGQKLQGQLALRSGALSASLASQGVHLERVVPPSWNVERLHLIGRAEAQGSLRSGLNQLQIRSLYLSGQQSAVGEFRVIGSATYAEGVAQAALDAQAFGGSVTARGALPSGLSITARHLNLKAYGLSSASGDVQLSGDLRNPVLSGSLQALRPEGSARAMLSGRAQDPRLDVRADLKAPYSGTLYAQVRQVNLQAPSAQLRVYGSAASSAGAVKLDLSGVWPQLRGQAVAQLQGLSTPVMLSGQGNGRYVLDGGALGRGNATLSGLNPVLSAAATLTPLNYLGASGEGQLQLNVQGPLSALQVTGSGAFTNIKRGALSLPDTTVTLSGPLSALSGEVLQNAQRVAQLSGKSLTFTNLGVQAAGSEITASGSASLERGLQLSAQLSSRGAVDSSAKLSYLSGRWQATGNLRAAGLSGAFDMAASPLNGWRGNVRLSGGPQLSGVGQVLSQPLQLSVSGRLESPQFAGTLGLVGAQATMVASNQGAQLRLRDGESAQANGLLTLSKTPSGYVWAGSGKVVRPQGEFDITLDGEAAQPQAQLAFRRGEWRVQGQASSAAANFDISDGQRAGTLSWDGKNFKLATPALDLARLGIDGTSGTLSLSGALDSNATGALSAVLSNVKTGATLPYLELPLAGSGTLGATLTQGVARAAVALTTPSGPLRLSASQVARGGPWSAALSSQLQHGDGQLSAEVSFTAGQASGKVTAQALPLKAGGVTAALSGDLMLSGQHFSLGAQAVSGMGRASLSGEGGLADLIPALGHLTGLKPTPQGYQVQAQLSSFDVAKLNLAPGLSGNVSGQLTLGDGSGTFLVRSSALKLGDTTLSSRIDGTLAGGDWRLRGYVGNSSLFGSVTGGQLNVRAQLEALPLGSVLTAFTGKTTGQGVLTGIARLSAPLADPLAGNFNLVAERVRVSAGEETLTGSGLLNFSNRELSELRLSLTGAGSWNVQGQYTHDKVDMNALFSGTTFTPVLALIPNLGEMAPTLKGTLAVQIGGRYDQPTATLSGQNLSGSVAGLQLQLPSLSAQVGEGGALSLRASLAAAGTLGGSGTLDASGQLTGSKLSGAVARYRGSLSAAALGDLGQAELALTQSGAGWSVLGSAKQGGTLTVSGQLSPSIDLSLSARSYNLPIRAIYARQSSLNADLRAMTQGEQITVGGAINFDRMVLGRVSAAAALPGTTTAPSAADKFNSPLPNELTVFPTDEAQGETRRSSPLLERVVLSNIPIRATNNIRVDESLAQAELSANLVLSGSGAAPRLSGQVQGLRGTLTLRDNDFTINSALASFDGASLYPTFALVAQGRVPNQNGQLIGVQLQADGNFVAQNGGRALSLTTALTCTTCTAINQYSQAELYSLLALGTPDVSAVGGNLGALGTSAVNTALNVFVLGELQRNIARALGVDVFRISSNLVTPSGNIDARFTVGTYLSKQLYIQYQVDLTGAGLIDATYTTDNNRFTFKVSTPISGLDLQSVRPSFSVSYNYATRSSVSLGLQSRVGSTRFSAGYVYRF